jgi:hypothetical protein
VLCYDRLRMQDSVVTFSVARFSLVVVTNTTISTAPTSTETVVSKAVQGEPVLRRGACSGLQWYISSQLLGLWCGQFSLVSLALPTSFPKGWFLLSDCHYHVISTDIVCIGSRVTFGYSGIKRLWHKNLKRSAGVISSMASIRI